MEKIAAIVVTYRPDIDAIEKSVRSISNNGANVIIVDNSEKKTLFPDMAATTVLSLGDNLGIAEAQNIGIKRAIELGYEWLIFFDQDSIIEDGFLEQLTKNARDDMPYVAAPVFYDNEKGFYYYLLDVDNSGRRTKIYPQNITNGLKISTVISSGMIINKRALDVVGHMRSDLFIDYVDTEWCLRAASKGVKIEIMKDAVMKHSIGDRSISLFGYKVPVHGYQRRYYRVRNAFALLRMAHVPKRLAIREIIFSFVHQSIIIFNEKNKWKYFKSYFFGVFDGLVGKMSKCSHEI